MLDLQSELASEGLAPLERGKGATSGMPWDISHPAREKY